MYNLSSIMSKAWSYYRNGGMKFSKALRIAWKSAKAAVINAKRISDAKAMNGVNEQVNTWAWWRKQGYEVIHGMKALFKCELIWASKGDGAVYNASFFGASQVRPIEQ